MYTRLALAAVGKLSPRFRPVDIGIPTHIKLNHQEQPEELIPSDDMVESTVVSPCNPPINQHSPKSRMVPYWVAYTVGVGSWGGDDNDNAILLKVPPLGVRR